MTPPLVDPSHIIPGRQKLIDSGLSVRDTEAVVEVIKRDISPTAQVRQIAEVFAVRPKQVPPGIVEIVHNRHLYDWNE